MNYADEIKRAVSMVNVCHQYGIAVNAAGFALCPFHSDSKPSMKVYDGSRGYHCYVCDAGSSVIDFVMGYFNIGYNDAIIKINDDFRLNLPIGSRQDSEKQKEIEAEARKRREEAARIACKRQEAADEYHNTLDAYIALERIIMSLKPVNENEITTAYADAVKNIDYASYCVDIAEAKLYEVQHEY